MHFSAILSLSAVAALVAAECCGSLGNCTGIGPCNIFCCNCDSRFRVDIVTKQCRFFGMTLRSRVYKQNRPPLVCRDAWTRDFYPSLKLARSLQIDHTAEDLTMLHEASGGMDSKSLEDFIKHSEMLGQTDHEFLVAKLKEYGLTLSVLLCDC
jgi:hypothetical protein